MPVRNIPVSLAVVAALALAFVAAACGGGSSTSATSTVETAPAGSATTAAATTAAATTAAASPTAAATTASASASASAVAGAQAVTVDITAHNTSFDKKEIDVAPGAHVTIHMTNDDAIIHNIAFYKDQAATQAIATGDLFKGPNVSKDLTFDAPTTPGSYYFHCDVHPDQMNGTFKVQ